MPRIFVLDQSTAAQIAAGEVVERPVSVVKELVENSLDAGADRVDIVIEKGGLELISVIDNGCGISQEDLPLAFHRHATSKIFRAEDLWQVSTLGFRGEALPSIAAVSRLEMVTCPAGFEAGGRILIRGGDIQRLGPAGCPPGTAIEVTELFFNTPARRKNMSSTATEAGLISDTVGRLALSRPDVAFSLKHNGRQIFYSPGSGTLLDTLVSLVGRQHAEMMLPVKASGDHCRIYGFTGHPSLHRSSRQQQIFFVNGRYVRGRVFFKGVQDAYRTLLSSGRHPAAVLFLELDPGLVDVNVHPAKLEVRLSGEDEITGLITRAIKEALKTPRMVVPVKQQAQSPPEQLTINLEPVGEDVTSDQGLSIRSLKGHPGLQEDFHPDQGQVADLSGAEELTSEVAAGQEISADVKGSGEMEPPGEEDRAGEVSPEAGEKLGLGVGGVKEEGVTYNRSAYPCLVALAQLQGAYILASGAEGLYIIDQHAAHERVLFESFLTVSGERAGASQMLLTPVPLELNYRQLQLVKGHLDLFSRLGFELEEFGETAFLLRGIPAGMQNMGAGELFLDVLEGLMEPGPVRVRADIYLKALALMSCKAAVKAGTILSQGEMQSLLGQLREAAEPYTCPHGRPTTVILTRREIEVMFGRA
ncbi:MAG: DNA mismatch repair endonuclease MutL [Bacillota bacterium]|jgi:DNA mismatch repair protein MutL